MIRNETNKALWIYVLLSGPVPKVSLTYQEPWGTLRFSGAGSSLGGTDIETSISWFHSDFHRLRSKRISCLTQEGISPRHPPTALPPAMGIPFGLQWQGLTLASVPLLYRRLANTALGFPS